MTTASIHLHDTLVGAITWNSDTEIGIFEYDAGFLSSGIEIAPLTMPLGPGRYSFPNLARDSFKGLPGLLADSLPDKFGNLLINQWLARQGRTPESFDPVERLCYLGSRAMGALEFHPKIFPDSPPETLHMEALVQLANDALASREALHVNLGEPPEALATILRVGTSAGGARAKAVVAWNPNTGEIRSGQVPLAPGFEAWLIKFDGVAENRDKELADPKGYGRIEYAYHLMARAAGITMTDCRLLEENGRAHFMTRRFDRTPDGDKFHLQSLCAIAHYDFNQAGAYSYEQAFQIARRLGLSQPELTELYRRALFNILSRNQDDHTKNISFMMDRRGVWKLAPAYDLIHSYNPNGAWTHRHQMTFAGKREDFTTGDLLEVAKAADVKTRAAKSIIAEVHEAVSRWPGFAETAGVSPPWIKQVKSEMRLDLHL